jgi:UDP-N-acetylglucosamine 2-epimerase (non-hydrolysing)
MINIICIVGARPNFIKIAPILKTMAKSKHLEAKLLHTGQHYDYNMSQSFFDELGIKEPDIYLGVGSASQAYQVAEIMKKFDDYCENEKPDAILVVGDVNSTMATSIVASKRRIKIYHVEAGIRSWDRTMPEEINRLLTDSIADVFLTPSVDAVENLLHEGHDKSSIYNVGNIMIDTLLSNQKKIDKSKILNNLSVKPKEYALITLHRPSNVDNKESLNSILNALNIIQKDYKLVFPVHPRTLKKIKEFSLEDKINGMENVIITSPLGYYDFSRLTRDSKFVLTDSGGIQEETTVYGIPCITLRDNTERPITVELGTNELAGNKMNDILLLYNKIKSGTWKKGRIPKYWDGKTSLRIVRVIEKTML